MFRKKKYNFLITGAKGQLGSYLLQKYTQLSLKENNCVGKVFGIGREDLDLTDAYAISDFLNTSTTDSNVKIDYVIHCAADTDTTAIEKEPDKFFDINVLAPKHLAHTCRHNRIKMIFISSDYVMSEKSRFIDYNEGVEPYPVNAYGMQKLLAEKYVEEAFVGKEKDYMILRSSWLFGNSKNSFVEKFLRNVFAKCNELNSIHKNGKGMNDDALSYVNCANDAFGKPTHVDFIANLILQLVYRKFYGKCDAQPLGPQISRANWAATILASLKEALAKNENIVDTDLAQIKIHEVSLSSMHLSLKHPEKIYFSQWQTANEEYYTAVADKLQNAYIESCICANKSKFDGNYTREYILQNYKQIMSDANYAISNTVKKFNW